MLTKRIIPCLDVKDGIVVKGKNFANLENTGDPVELARRYYEQGADELVFLDINATNEKRKTMIDVVRKVAAEICIPLTVGGGIRTVEDIRDMLSAGADKVSLNSSAVNDPTLISRAAEMFGSQCIVIAIDAKRESGSWKVYVNGARERTSLDAVEWAVNAAKLGAGEILLTSIDSDGMKKGYDLELNRIISESVRIPVIASGGAGGKEDIADVLKKGKADAALAASIFHYNECSVMELKRYLKSQGIRVRT